MIADYSMDKEDAAYASGKMCIIWFVADLDEAPEEVKAIEDLCWYGEALDKACASTKAIEEISDYLTREGWIVRVDRKKMGVAFSDRLGNEYHLYGFREN